MMLVNTSVFLFIVDGQDAFREFLRSEFSDENIEFWLACEDYKKTEANHLHSKAEKIYKEFVQCDATKQVRFKSRNECLQGIFKSA